MEIALIKNALVKKKVMFLFNSKLNSESTTQKYCIL